LKLRHKFKMKLRFITLMMTANHLYITVGFKETSFCFTVYFYT